MPKARLVIEVEWPDIPLGPLDDVRPYADRLLRRSLHVQKVFADHSKAIREALNAGDPDMRCREVENTAQRLPRF